MRIASDAFEDKNRYPNVPIIHAGATSHFNPIIFAQEKGD